MTKKQQLGNATKTPETGRNGRQKGRFFSPRPVTWCILVNQKLNRLYLLAYMRFYFPEDLRIKVRIIPPRMRSWK